MSELLEANNLSVDYGRKGHRVRAVDDVCLTVRPGEVLGLVGESGCGKSSLGRALVGLEPAATGEARFNGQPVSVLGRRQRPAHLRTLQMVFQDPYASLNPRRRVGDLIADGVILANGTRAEATRAATELLDRVGLPVDSVDKYPHEFSGGQRQRLAIARTLAARPSCIVADEPISALDASAQAQVANLLLSLARDNAMGMVFISHDLSVVRQIADRVAVMYLGRIIEIGDTRTIWNSPKHPYTEALVSAIPRPDGSGTLPVDLPGDVPDPAHPPRGCRFHPRCPIAEQRCADHDPRLVQIGDREVACLVRAPSATH
jgi:oligopeptide/dipeptide ABC transporter ATP-binding protein